MDLLQIAQDIVSEKTAYTFFSDASDENTTYYVDDNEVLIRLVDQEHGDGDGAQIWAVFHIQVGDKTAYFQINGTRNSWDSDYWDNEVILVQPREVTVTRWFAV